MISTTNAIVNATIIFAFLFRFDELNLIPIAFNYNLLGVE